MAGVAVASTIQALLAEARTAGLEVTLDGMEVLLRGPRNRHAMAEQLLDRRDEVVAALVDEEREIAWRAGVLRPMVPARGPIPFLVVRETAYQPGRCHSCGDELHPAERFRCWPCAEAARRVLAEGRAE
jgi:hypothetical protein